MAHDSTAHFHQEWIGYVQPVGIVVSTPALLEAGAAINRNFVPLHNAFLGLLPRDRDGNPIPELSDFPAFAVEVLGWRACDLSSPAERFIIPIAGYEEALQPTWVVNDGDTPILLILRTAADFDKDAEPDPRRWNASPQLRFERLLRETGVPAGLVVSPSAIRLVYAPKGESSGHITFRVADMAQVAGRPILAALHMLLSAERLFTLGAEQRLPALLAASRKHQNVVSTKLAGQVMEALFDLLRGFQAAHDQNGILTEVLRDDPNQVYAGLLTVLLRLVFVLYAEDRDLLSADPIYVNNYSVSGLFERLREDQAHHPDTMDSRYGAWARLLALFRLIWQGARHGGMRIPGRRGYLFEPDRYPFLEGRAAGTGMRIPRVADGVIYRVLQRLLVLDGERLSYRNLDVEQIGSVYEAMMGFQLQMAGGPSIAIKAKKRHGAPVTVNLSELLNTAPGKRNDWLNKSADQKLSGQAETALKQADTIDALMAALDRRIARNVTPDPVPAGSLIFQPSPERRRSGSHYTPRSLTQPIVEAALAPVLKGLGPQPKPEQILALKVCDPAMGSGAFLVEACRQLGDALSESWHFHRATPPLPPDEDELLHARRTVAQRCLYGVDKNEMAADLAKLSLWLATLARDHEFTFLNHALRHGDSLAGLSARQIAAFHWEPKPASSFREKDVRERISRAAGYRKQILESQDDTPYSQLAQKLEMADQQLSVARIAGDAAMAAFFSAEKRGEREKRRDQYEAWLRDWLEHGKGQAGIELADLGRALRKQEQPVVPFHWEIEFPEVFDLDDFLLVRGGFDAIVGNPPFMSGTKISQEYGQTYFEWLTKTYPPAGHLCDLVAYFFRRAFALLGQAGTFGLIATNTIAQGDTREGGLLPILQLGGQIFSARKRFRWPGEAAVVISQVHVSKGNAKSPIRLDGHPVERISAFLLEGHDDCSPARLPQNPYFSAGSKIYGQGFVFDDADSDANTTGVLNRVLQVEPTSANRIFPYIGGEEVNSSPAQQPSRKVMYLSDIKTEEDLEATCPELARIAREKVKPERDLLGSNPNNIPLKRRWWAYQAHRPELYSRIRGLSRVLVNSQVSGHLAFAFLPTSWIFAHTLNVFEIEAFGVFAVLQSRIHEIWARFFSSSMKDDLRYTASDCFETFPLPNGSASSEPLERIGEQYFAFRADLMIAGSEGLTKTYNRFHRPDEYSPGILKLRELHDAMDRTVLDAYGWNDIQPKREFFPEFNDDEADDDDGGRSRQKRYRYRWQDEIHDEVLARLLALNRERASVPPPPTVVDEPPKAAAKKPRKSSRTNEKQGTLL